MPETPRAQPRAEHRAIRVGIGGWTYEPWRGSFYPVGHPQKRELEFASRAVTSIEINGTYYSSFTPDVWARWRDETPSDFVFAVKASRYCTNRKSLLDAGPSVERFLSQGIAQLGTKLGPINWQLMPTKSFDEAEIAGFLASLPGERDGLALRHAIEVRHASFVDKRFYELARAHGAAIVVTDDAAFPNIDQPTAAFTYARLMGSTPDEPSGYPPASLAGIAKRATKWAKRGDTFVYFISGAKERNPAAALALLRTLASPRSPSR